MTSHDVVEKVRQILGTKKVGHSGTLDPLASGLMILLINQGTKLSSYLLNAHKTYRVFVKLGIRTDTWDQDGRTITEQKTEHLSCEKIKQVIEKHTGVLSLRVPDYSAVKFQGKKLYEYARQHTQNEKIKVPKIYRDMSFDQLEIIEIQPSCFKASVRASKGSFIRSWASHIGEELGVGAVVSAIERITSEPYTLKQAISLDTLKAWPIEQKPGFIPLEETLPNWPRYVVRGRWEKCILNGILPEEMQWDIKNRLSQMQEEQGIKVYSATNKHLLVLLKYNSTKSRAKIACVFSQNALSK